MKIDWQRIQGSGFQSANFSASSFHTLGCCRAPLPVASSEHTITNPLHQPCSTPQDIRLLSPCYETEPRTSLPASNSVPQSKRWRSPSFDTSLKLHESIGCSTSKLESYRSASSQMLSLVVRWSISYKSRVANGPPAPTSIVLHLRTVSRRGRALLCTDQSFSVPSIASIEQVPRLRGHCGSCSSNSRARSHHVGRKSGLCKDQTVHRRRYGREPPAGKHCKRYLTHVAM